jgi:hypothetical protein
MKISCLKMSYGPSLLHTINSAQPLTKEWKAEYEHTKGTFLAAAIRESSTDYEMRVSLCSGKSTYNATV